VDPDRPAVKPSPRERRRWGSRGAAALVVGVPGAYLGIFFAWPLVGIVTRGLTDNAAIGSLLSRAHVGPTAWFTTWQAAASTVLTLLVGLPAAWAVSRHTFRGRALLRAMLVAPFVLPTVVVGAALNAAFERLGLDSGPLRLRHTVWAVLLAHLVFNVAVVIRIVGGRWALLDTRPAEAARTLGARPWQVWREVTWPALAPAIRAAASIVFLFCFTSFGVILVVGSPGRPTLETEIWRYATQRTDFATAAALAIVQLGAVVALLLVTTRAERSLGPVARIGRVTAANRLRNSSDRVRVAIPLVALTERSLRTGDTCGFANFRSLSNPDPRLQSALLVTPITAVRNSLVVAVAATALAVVIGALAAAVVVYGRRGLRSVFDLGMMVPLGTSAVTLGFGILITLDTPPFDLRTSWWIVPIAQSLVGIPFVMRSTIPVLRAIDPRTREAAAVLGASPARVRLEVDWPIGRRALLVGAGFAFAVSLGEFGATSFLVRPDSPTVPVVIFRLLGLPGAARSGQAMALAFVLASLTIASVVVIERLRPRDSAGW
jgi:thiamine transport system permease protein